MNQSGAAGGPAGGRLARGATGSPVPTGGPARELLARAQLLLESARAVPADRANAVAAVRSVLDPLLDSLVGQELARIPVSRLKDVTEGRLRLGALEQAGLATVRAGPRHGPLRAPADSRGRGAHRRPGAGGRRADRPRGARHRLGTDRRGCPGRREHRAGDRPAPAGRGRCGRAARGGRGPAAGGTAGPPGGDGRPGREPAADAVRGAAVPGAGAGGTRRGAVGRGGRGGTGSCRCSSRRRRPTCCAPRHRPPRPGWTSSCGPPSTTACSPSCPAAAPTGTPPKGSCPPGSRTGCGRCGSTTRFCGCPCAATRRSGQRFALAQKRVIIGDEMGLGKTVQAIAALAHLAARGETHFLVVCPASVLINWTREIRALLHPARRSGARGGARGGVRGLA